MQRIHAAVLALKGPHLDCPIGRKVFAEFAEVLPVVIAEHEDRIAGVFLHRVHEIGLQEIDCVLEPAPATNQGDFLRVVLDGNEGQPLPVKALYRAGVVQYGNVILFLRIGVRRKRPVFKNIGRHAVGLKNIGLADNLLLGAFVDLYGIKPNRGIELRVRSVRPERQHLVTGEKPEGELVILVVEGIEPRNAGVEALDPRVFQHPHKALAENLLDLLRVLGILAVEGDRLAK